MSSVHAMPMLSAMWNEYTLLPQFAQPGGFAAPLVFLPLGCLVAGPEAAHLDFKSGKPEHRPLYFVGIVAHQQPEKKRMRTGEHKSPRGLAF